MKTTIIEKSAENALVALTGELDTSAVEDFKKSMEPLLDGSVKVITLDFSELEYISSAGLRIILLINKTCKVTIKGMSEDIKQIFQLTGFDNMIQII